MEPMRFLFTLHNFFPEPVYGAERAAILQMAELLRQGHAVGLFHAGNAKPAQQQLAENGLTGIRLFPARFLNTKAQVLLSAWKPHVGRRFARTLKTFAPDVIIFHHLVRLSLDLPLIGRRAGIPMLYYLHDFHLVCPSYSLMHNNQTICRGPRPLKCARCLFSSRFRSAGRWLSPAVLAGVPFLLLRNALVNQIQSRVDLFISPSRFLLTEMRRLGLNLADTRVIPCGTRESYCLEARTGKTPVGQRVRFGFMGNIVPKKGVHVLARAFHGELGRDLLIRGFSSPQALAIFQKEFPDLEATLEIYHPEKADFFSNVDVVIVPSVWYENQPLVIIEAFQAGKPVICSDLGGMAEMVRHHAYGLLFKTGDAEDLRRKALHLSQNPAEVSRMAALIPPWPSVEENIEQILAAIPRK